MQHNFDESIDRTHTNSMKWAKYPKDILPLWVADSDFKCPQPLVEAVVKLAEHGIYGYPYADEGSFEKATVHWMQKRFNWTIDPKLVDFVPSLGTGLALAVKAFTEKGDNVLIQTPIYPPFQAVVKYNQRKTVNNSLVWRDGKYQIDFEDFEKLAADPKTKLFLLCNPHNPSGRAFTREELHRMGDICLKHGVAIFSDEIHCDYIFKGHKHIPIATLSPELAKITVTGINPSKTFNIAGMRTAAVVSTNENIRTAFRSAILSCKLGRNPLGIAAYASAYLDCEYYADQVCAYVEGNIEHAVSVINDTMQDKLKTYKPDATYLLWIDCSGLNMSQERLEQFFLEKARVALNSGTSFGPEGTGFMRLNTACPRSVLDEGLQRIEKAIQAL